MGVLNEIKKNDEEKDDNMNNNKTNILSNDVKQSKNNENSQKEEMDEDNNNANMPMTDEDLYVQIVTKEYYKKHKFYRSMNIEERQKKLMDYYIVSSKKK